MGGALEGLATRIPKETSGPKVSDSTTNGNIVVDDKDVQVYDERKTANLWSYIGLAAAGSLISLKGWLDFLTNKTKLNEDAIATKAANTLATSTQAGLARAGDPDKIDNIDVTVNKVKADLYRLEDIEGAVYESFTPQPTILYSDTATFNYTGYGFPIGLVVNFDSIRVLAKASQSPPTQFRVVIQENNRDGAVLANQVFNPSFLANTDTELVFQFVSKIVNENNVPLWVEIRGNDAFGLAIRNPATVFTEAAGYPKPYQGTGLDSIDAKPNGFFTGRELWIKIATYADRLIFSDKAAVAVHKEINNRVALYKSNYIKRNGEIVYISSKFDSTQDWLCQFEKCMANELYTFRQIGLVNNPKKYLDPLLVDYTPTNILNITNSDNIGPVSINGSFIGGNHTHNNDNVTKTAITNSFRIFADGVEVLDGESGYCNELLILVQNTLYDPVQLPAVQSPLIKESVAYRVRGCNIEASVKHEYLADVFISHYYGLQSVGNANFTQIYYGHSQYIDVVAKAAGDSGSNTTYPNVEKIVLCSADKSICQSMLMNKARGLGSSTATKVINLPLAFSSASKHYFRLLQNQSYTAGQNTFWNGCYSWFNQLEKESIRPNTVFAYDSQLEGKKVYLADFKGAEVQELLNTRLEGEPVTVVQKDESITVDDFASGCGISIISNSVGSLQIR